jgi:hypothetical protein
MNTTLLYELNLGFRQISRIGENFPFFKRTAVLSTLLLLTFIAPACAPNEPPPERAVSRNLVLLTDTTQWNNDHLEAYKDSLTAAGYRVLVSGYPSESAAELSARLPWLLQPGVDLFLYDERLSGKPGKDSLMNFLNTTGHPARVTEVTHE